MLLIEIPKITEERALSNYEKARIRKLSILRKRDLLAINDSLHPSDRIRLQRQLSSCLCQ